MLLANINPTFLLAGLVILGLTCIYLLYLHLSRTHDLNTVTSTVNALIQQNRNRDEVVNFLLTSLESLKDTPVTATFPPNTHPGVPVEDLTSEPLAQDDYNTNTTCDETPESVVHVNVSEWHDNVTADEANDLLDSVLQSVDHHESVPDITDAEDNDVVEYSDQVPEVEEPCDTEELVNEDVEAEEDVENSNDTNDVVEDESASNEAHAVKYEIDMTKNKSRLNGLTVSLLRKGAAERGISLHGTNKMAIVNEIYNAL